MQEDKQEVCGERGARGLYRRGMLLAALATGPRREGMAGVGSGRHGRVTPEQGGQGTPEGLQPLQNPRWGRDAARGSATCG